MIFPVRLPKTMSILSDCHKVIVIFSVLIKLHYTQRILFNVYYLNLFLHSIMQKRWRQNSLVHFNSYLVYHILVSTKINKFSCKMCSLMGKLFKIRINMPRKLIKLFCQYLHFYNRKCITIQELPIT